MGGGGDDVTDPPFVDVRVVSVSRLPAGCPDGDNLCYPMCAHSNSPAGLQAVVPLWGADAATRRGRARALRGGLGAVPTNTRLQLSGRDLRMDCVDACNYPPVLEDILLNGTKLTTLVRDGLPAGVRAALEFSADGQGAIRP